VTSLPRGKARDNAISSVCNLLRQSDPEGALKLARQIDDEALRKAASVMPKASTAGGAKDE
jgi:hypothetical protein